MKHTDIAGVRQTICRASHDQWGHMRAVKHAVTEQCKGDKKGEQKEVGGGSLRVELDGAGCPSNRSSGRLYLFHGPSPVTESLDCSVQMSASVLIYSSRVNRFLMRISLSRPDWTVFTLRSTVFPALGSCLECTRGRRYGVWV